MPHRPAGGGVPDDRLEVVEAAGRQLRSRGLKRTEFTPPAWPPVIFFTIPPEATSMTTGAGAVPLATATRLSSGLIETAEIRPIPGAKGRNARCGARRFRSPSWSGALGRGAASRAPSWLMARASGGLLVKANW
jgi:hypothetical protein